MHIRPPLPIDRCLRYGGYMLICRSLREGDKIYFVWVMHIQVNSHFLAHFAPGDFWEDLRATPLPPVDMYGGMDPSAKGVGSVLGSPQIYK